MDAVNSGLDDRLFKYLKKSIKETPYYEMLDIELQLLAPGYSEFRVVTSHKHSNPMGLIHGGLIMSIADAAMGNAIRSLAIKAVTVDMSTSLPAGARIEDTIVAQGKVLRAGQKLLFAEAEVKSGDKLLGYSKATFFKISDLHY